MRELNKQERLILDALESAYPRQLRSDYLARRLGVTPPDVTNVAVKLRDEGFVFFKRVNEGDRYGYWQLAPNGKLSQCLHRKEKADIDSRQGKYILWCPTSSLPPKVVHDTYEKAVEVAELMAKKNKGQEFIVCKQVESHQLVLKEVQRVERVWTKEKKAC